MSFSITLWNSSILGAVFSIIFHLFCVLLYLVTVVKYIVLVSKVVWFDDLSLLDHL